MSRLYQSALGAQLPDNAHTVSATFAAWIGIRAVAQILDDREGIGHQNLRYHYNNTSKLFGIAKCLDTLCARDQPMPLWG